MESTGRAICQFIDYANARQSYRRETESPSTVISLFMRSCLFVSLDGWLVGWFYGISTIVSYLMPNPFYAY